MSEADAANAVNLFQVPFAHHSPNIRTMGQAERHAFADYRDVAVIGIAGKDTNRLLPFAMVLATPG